MATILLVIHLIIAVALVATILLQRSEGGALGIGGGGGGGLMTGRAAGNVLTRSSAILGACFFATSIGLTAIAQLERSADSIFDESRIFDDSGPGNAVPAPELEAPIISEPLVPEPDVAEPSEPRVPRAD